MIEFKSSLIPVHKDGDRFVLWLHFSSSLLKLAPLNKTVTFLLISCDWWETNTTPGRPTFHCQPSRVELICSQVAAGHWLLRCTKLERAGGSTALQALISSQTQQTYSSVLHTSYKTYSGFTIAEVYLGLNRLLQQSSYLRIISASNTNIQ